MNCITVITDAGERASNFQTQFARHFQTECVHPESLPKAAPGQFTLIDIDVRNPKWVSTLKLWLERRPACSHVIFGVNRKKPIESIQAYALGATDVICRPVDARLVVWKLSGGPGAIVDGDGKKPFEICENLSTSMNALRNIFSAALLEDAPDLELVETAGTAIIERIEEVGLTQWLEVVRMHHSQTYQHSLIVTSVAVSFGQQLGLNDADKKRLASAGLLHDIGKARIPIEILEKPAALDDDEMAIMRTHPLLGYDALKGVRGLNPDMLDLVVHHHEYLDGSGYPHGLKGNEISDLNRTITIADIFGALIERRAYKPPMPGGDAYRILEGMGDKLDRDLVREFLPIAQSII